MKAGRTPAGRRRLAPALASALMLACTACGRGDPPAEGAPTYSEPSYATSPGGVVATRLRFTGIAAEAGIDFEHATGAFGEK